MKRFGLAARTPSADKEPEGGACFNGYKAQAQLPEPILLQQSSLLLASAWLRLSQCGHMLTTINSKRKYSMVVGRIGNLPKQCQSAVERTLRLDKRLSPMEATDWWASIQTRLSSRHKEAMSPSRGLQALARCLSALVDCCSSPSPTARSAWCQTWY